MSGSSPPVQPLAECAGFRVRSPEGHLGFVESVWLDPDTGETYLSVRAGRIIVLVVPVAEVESVSAETGLVVLGRNGTRLVAEPRGDRIVLRPPLAPRHAAA